MMISGSSLNNNIKLIGLVGRKRSGKDSVADYLISNNQFKKYSFADPLKRALIEIFGFTENQMWGSEKDKETIDPRWNISPRKAMQIVGTELFQYAIHTHLTENPLLYNGASIGRNFWVHRFKLLYENDKKSVIKDAILLNNSGLTNGDPVFNVVVADLRFVHEANAIRELGGSIWKIVRPSMESNDNHASEVELESIIPDVIIANDKTLQDLYNKVDDLVK